ncbi:hypothetical protein AC578_5893 [Pseudocercospora eumusae]|uniref:Uncharacterized protein n=1 Tax=Pseudocercospora eumusae TaxID=321146 RepID=A0A139HBF8_9PEZI|nr:hypothetical protein AC578_5893 [Pseudocercospora eumusae]
MTLTCGHHHTSAESVPFTVSFCASLHTPHFQISDSFRIGPFDALIPCTATYHRHLASPPRWVSPSPPSHANTCNCVASTHTVQAWNRRFVTVEKEYKYSSAHSPSPSFMLRTAVALHNVDDIVQAAADTLQNFFEVLARFLAIAYEDIFKFYDFISKEVASSDVVVAISLGIARAHRINTTDHAGYRAKDTAGGAVG